MPPCWQPNPAPPIVIVNQFCETSVIIHLKSFSFKSLTSTHTHTHIHTHTHTFIHTLCTYSSYLAKFHTWEIFHRWNQNTDQGMFPSLWDIRNTQMIKPHTLATCSGQVPRKWPLTSIFLLKKRGDMHTQRNAMNYQHFLFKRRRNLTPHTPLLALTP